MRTVLGLLALSALIGGCAPAGDISEARYRAGTGPYSGDFGLWDQPVRLGDANDIVQRDMWFGLGLQDGIIR